MTTEQQIKEELIKRLSDLKYMYHEDIRDKTALKLNFRQKFETLNRVKLTDTELDKLLTEMMNPNVFKTSNLLRKRT